MSTLQAKIARYATIQCVLGGIALIVVTVFYFAAIRPAQNERAAILASISAQKLQLNEGRAKAQNLPVIEAEVAQLRSRLERFDKKLPKKPDMDQFMREITRVSEASLLKKVSVQPGSPKRSELFSEMPIALNFTGEFPNVLNFLQQTEEMQRLTRVRSLGIKTRDAQNGMVEVDVSMSIYFADE